MKTFYGLIALAISLLLVSCNNKSQKNSTDENVISDTKTKVDEEVVKPDSILIIGIWQRQNKKMWMEFKSDGTFNFGKEKQLLDENRHWRIDYEKNKLYIDFSKGAKYIEYKVNNKVLQINMQEKGKTVELYRIGIRPDHQNP